MAWDTCPFRKLVPRELIGETLPDVIRKVEDGEGYPRRLDRTLR